MYRYWFLFIGIISIITISIALIAEHIFNLEPCSMCLKQRHPYYFIIFIFLIYLIIRQPFAKIWFYIGVQLSSLYGLFYSIWHVGIEQKILKGPSSCSVSLDLSQSVANLKEQIMTKSVVNCEEVVWNIFGISAATINTFILLLIFILNAIYLYNYHGPKKNKAV